EEAARCPRRAAPTAPAQADRPAREDPPARRPAPRHRPHGDPAAPQERRLGPTPTHPHLSITETAHTMADTPKRNTRKTMVGVVASRSGDKTVKVSYAYKIPHPVYGKEINRKTVVAVHDEKNECAVGDRVTIMETRPI